MTVAYRGAVGAVIVAAGSGARFGDPDKVFAPLAGKPLLEHSLRLMASDTSIDQIVVVLAPHNLARGAMLLAELRPRDAAVCEGGPTRGASVRAGIAALDPSIELVAVHDAARPLLSRELLRRVIAAARISGAAIPGIPVTDTIQQVDHDGMLASSMNRCCLRAIQTPQVARRESLEYALTTNQSESDEGSLLHAAGYSVRVVEGDVDNVKVTRPIDLPDRRGDCEPAYGCDVMRIGVGYDIHGFDPTRRLRLGGVDFPGEMGLAGHSDADVALHAIADALLGSAALGDIGDHFPPDDERWKDTDSAGLLRLVAALVGERFLIGNIDVSIVAEQPRIAPMRLEMRERIADILGIESENVSVKATTNEKLGAIGRREGIAAIAVVLLAERGGV